jgi:hypothetical protein
LLNLVVVVGDVKADYELCSIAWMQMYFAISQVYQPGGPDIELFESNESDIRLAHGYVFPQPRLDSEGVKVVVHSPPKSSAEVIF